MKTLKREEIHANDYLDLDNLRKNIEAFTLRWNPSTDDSGKFSYRVKVTWLHIPGNTEHFVFQTQTTYTVQSLAAFGNYSFAVYAVDGSGNRSGDSNAVTANTPGDTIPPSGPVLQAS